MSDFPTGWARDFFRGLRDDHLEQVFSAAFPESMARDLKTLGPYDAAEMTGKYLDAGEESRADILAFLESNGPRRIDHLRAKEEDGTPLPEELGEWPGEDL